MSTLPDARRRLAALMEDRRVELGLRWQDVADAATAAGFKVSLKTLHSVRAGTADVRPLTRRGIEVGLQWEAGSVQAILDDRDPAPLPDAALITTAPEQVPRPPADADLIVGAFGLFRQVAVSIEDQVRAEIQQAKAQHGDDVPGEAITTFDKVERLMWNLVLYSEEDRIGLIVSFRGAEYAQRSSPPPRIRRAGLTTPAA